METANQQPAPPTYEGTDTEEAELERTRVAAGELPQRYAEPWGRPFFSVARPALVSGVAVLDVGSGRSPTLPPEARPTACQYVGLDASKAELELAGEGAYDRVIVADISRRVTKLEQQFDLILSWQVLEHVDSMADALANMRAYLRPGGLMVAQISGSFAAFSLLARVIPHRISSKLMERFLGVDPDEKFPTRYDRCHASALEPLLGAWAQHGIVARYKGGAYFRFSPRLERAYIRYENWVERSNRPNLATHYVIWAVK